MNEGWKCPVCGRGVAPSEKTCDHGAAKVHLAPNGPPSWPNVPRTNDWWGPPYEITSGGVAPATSIGPTSTGVLWNDSSYQGAGHNDYSFPRSFLWTHRLGQDAGNA